MILKFPESLTFNNVTQIIAEVKDSADSSISLDFSNTKYVDTGGINYVLLIPYLAKDRIKEILIDSKSGFWQFAKSTGISEELQNNFYVREPGRNYVREEYDENRNLKSFKEKYQHLLSSNLESNALLRTYLASNTKNRRILSILGKEFKEFFKRYPSSSANVGTCVIELLDNIFQHSQESIGAITFHLYNVGNNSLKSGNRKEPYLYIAVSDLGIGIKESLIRGSLISEQEEDSTCIKMALEKGISTTNQKGRGFGLNEVLNSSNRLSIFSGLGRVLINNDSRLKKLILRESSFHFEGTTINCIVKLKNETIANNK